ncbi:Olfactory receptor 4C13 [Tupaia chinensis]|uniref:Olfactory receptor 4C13 n=1 Tax=Tupaia chinensis TaxID=246437 RepID=L9KP53_TUPCH|nr:Olfactory receptor 4C13 [Tupaia chinensis]
MPSTALVTEASYTYVTIPRMIIDHALLEENHLLWGPPHSAICGAPLGGSEIILLIVMAYDHYVAICKPLPYMTIMRHGLCHVLVVVTWIGGMPYATVQILFMVLLALL